ncbi:ester cyclase [Haladaptatus salinisoli]|uniref:ester cyclase n=1 Tax=Haladaptatus salinisoli TaxID=2884876 RepID=UPI001D09A9FF|nr:ester cyclase [Haladaptatus salinisoli]
MTLEENKELVRRDTEEVWGDENVELIDEIYDEDFVLHDPSSPDETGGRDEYKEYVETYRTAFPDAEYAVEEMVAEGDSVALRYTARGTHEGELAGIEPTGERVTVSGMELYRVANGKIAEMWTNYDALGVFQQLGVVPPLDELARESGGD